MDIVDIGPWRLGIDPQQTREAFRALGPTWDGCDCLYCENLRAALATHVPASLRELLGRLGVDARCYTHTSFYIWNGPTDKNLYQVWWHAVGTVMCSPPSKPGWWPSSDLEDGVTITLHERRDCLREEFPNPTLQLDAFFSVHWVLDRKP